MCGRYAASKDVATLVEEFGIDTVGVDPLPPNYNVAPTNDVYAVRERRRPADDDGHRAAGDPGQGDVTHRELTVVRWGLVPSWAKDPSMGSKLINARLESLAEKASFKRALLRRRVIIPADGYYEWYRPSGATSDRKVRKQPYFIRRPDGHCLAMAGLCEVWRSRDAGEHSDWLVTTSIITRPAARNLAAIHDRMPVHLDPSMWDRWLDPETTSAAEILALLAEPASELVAMPVGTAVNSVRNNGPHLLDPLPAADGPPAVLA